MEHSFNVEDAIKYGIEKAVILKNLSFWIAKNIANKKHSYDGFTWTYNSTSAFAELFPYMSSQKIGRLLRDMESDGVIRSGNYNKAGYDRTKWYTVPSLFIVQNQTMDCSNLNDALLRSEQPIPDSKPDDKPVIKDTVLTQASAPVINKNTYPDEFEWIWANKPNREGNNPKKDAFKCCNARLKEGATWKELAEGMVRYKRFCQAKGIINTEKTQMMRTFFGTGENFKQEWTINAGSQQNSSSTGGQLTAAERTKAAMQQHQQQSNSVPAANQLHSQRQGGLLLDQDGCYLGGQVDQPTW